MTFMKWIKGEIKNEIESSYDPNWPSFWIITPFGRSGGSLCAMFESIERAICECNKEGCPANVVLLSYRKFYLLLNELNQKIVGPTPNQIQIYGCENIFTVRVREDDQDIVECIKE